MYLPLPFGTCSLLSAVSSFAIGKSSKLRGDRVGADRVNTTSYSPFACTEAKAASCDLYDGDSFA